MMSKHLDVQMGSASRQVMSPEASLEMQQLKVVSSKCWIKTHTSLRYNYDMREEILATVMRFPTLL